MFNQSKDIKISVSPPPSENLPIFYPDVFELDDSNLISTTNINRVVNVSNSTQSATSTNGALVVSGGLGVARDVYSAGIVHASTSRQSTAPTNGTLFVSGGLGVNRNFHFGGTVNVPVGFVGAPTFSFVSNPNTGIFQNGSNVVGIAANGLLRVSHSARTSTINNVLSLPTTGSVTEAALNFGTANTVLFSLTSSSLNFTVAGAQRLDTTGSRVSYALPIQLSAGAQTAPLIYFSTSTQTGFYLPNTIQIGITVAGTLRQTIDVNRMITNIPKRLHNDGTNFSDFGYYKVSSQVMIMRYSATQTFFWNNALVRIGSTVVYWFSDDVNLYTIANGPRAIQSETNTIPSRFRPSINQAFKWKHYHKLL